MKVSTIAEIREIDRRAMADFGIPDVVLMENAGVQVTRQLETIFGSLACRKIVIFAGKGNNGGDGCVAARHLYNLGAKVRVFLLGNKTELSGPSKVNMDIICQMGIEVLEITGERDWDKVKLGVAFAEGLVDALLGTGFRGELKGDMAIAVNIINTSGKKVIAIDIPSGVEADTGQVRSIAVKATHTVTLCLLKPGLLLYPGAGQAGEITVADIGVPSILVKDDQIHQNIITDEYIRAIFPVRPRDAHKGTSGRVMIVAGSKGLTGAAALSSMGALRGGAGLVTLCIAASLHDIMEIKLMEVMTKPLPEIAGGAMGLSAVSCIEELALTADSVAIGPGLGRNAETAAAVQAMVKRIERPLVIDADALNALVEHENILLEAKALPILTPHPGEMGRLIGLSPKDINADRIYVARQGASQWGSIVVLKGAPTVVAFPDGEVYINTTGNEGMAIGGSGDVLTGLIAALVAQGLSSHLAAVAGVYIHGLAGDIAAAKTGMVGMTAGDILEAIPEAIHKIRSVA